MPELPEVETIVRGLRRALPGRGITGVHLGKTDFMIDPVALAESLPGRRVMKVERLGKFICLELESPGGVAAQAQGDLSLVVHLGMTGRLVVCSDHEPVAPHTHAVFYLDDGRELRYTDIRRFGRIELLRNDALAALRGRLGEDPLEISAQEFCRRLGSRHARIKSLLLDQSVLRGVGNIYADESLWRARIHPARLAAQLTERERIRLLAALRAVLLAAIAHRGSSISDFLDAEGRPGSYQRRHRVYQRTGKPCPRCGALIRRATIGGRSSHFCPRCQRAPRAGSHARRKSGRRSSFGRPRNASQQEDERKKENANHRPAGESRARHRRRAHRGPNP